MRNLTAGNKMNFTMFVFIVLIIIFMIIIAVVNGLKNTKEKYEISSSACVYDYGANYIELENDSLISKKWTGNYYLKEDETKKEYKLGNYSVVYDRKKKSLDLFGTFYEVKKGGDIVKILDHNFINSTMQDKFYKISDRRYLIIGKNIKNNTGSLSTENYLIVIIDKSGNALLLNNEINAKTINEMIITTDDFEFDVANEILKYNDEIINLKKIIGSSNQYIQRVAEKDDKDGNENKVSNNTEQNVQSNSQQSTTTTTTTTSTSASETTSLSTKEEVNKESNENKSNEEKNVTDNNNAFDNTVNDNQQSTDENNIDDNHINNQNIIDENSTSNAPINENIISENIINENIINQNNITENSTSQNITNEDITNQNSKNEIHIGQNNTNQDNKNTTDNNSAGKENDNSKENESNKKDNEQDLTWIETLNTWMSEVAAGFRNITSSKNEKKEGKLSKNISLNSLDAGTTFVDVNYTVTDPENQYNVVYVIITGEDFIKTFSLDKNASTYRITELEPNKNYVVEMGYKIIYSDSSVEEVKQDTMTTRTLIPKEELKITRVSLNKIYYTLKLDNDYVYDNGCKIKVYLNDTSLVFEQTLRESDLEKAAISGYSDSFEIPQGYKEKNAEIKILLEDTYMNEKSVQNNLSAKIVNY